jgi:hypothetical protein
MGVVVLVASCTGDNLVRPDDPSFPPPASFALVDGSTGGNAGFYFLPPLVDNPSITGTFNPDLLPEVQVCLLDSTNTECAATQPPALPYWGPGEVSVQDSKYAVSWDTDDPRWRQLDPDRNYRIVVSLSGTEMGSMDVNPQDPNGSTPGEDLEGLYAFRLGETLPVKFWLSQNLFCDPSDPTVLQCAEAGVLDEEGGALALDPFGTGQTGVLMTVTLPPDALPAGYPAVTLTLERLDNTQVDCLPTLDAPQYGPCFRITTEPELTDGLQAGFEALVAICVDPHAFGLDDDQDDLLQIHRYHEDANGTVIQALANAQAPECAEAAPSGLALLPVPDHGLLRYAARGVNALAGLVGPRPLAAAHLGLGGLTSSFSQFRWALPGGMNKVNDDFVIEWGATSNEVSPTVLVLDRGVPAEYGLGFTRDPAPVEGATVHFDGIGDAVTGPDGLASVTWTPSGVGSHELTAYAVGLYDEETPIPDHSGTATTLVPLSVTFSATVVGAPASMTVSGSPEDGAEVASTGVVSATVADENQVTVGTAHVTWTLTSPGCDNGTEPVCGSVVDNGDGTATWTLGQLVGDNTLVGTVDGADGVSSSVTVTTVPAAADQVVIDEITDPVVGRAYPLSGMSRDAFGNDRPADALSWSVDTGTVSGTTWTLGTVAGATNTVTASVDGTDPLVSATYAVAPAPDVPDRVTALGGDGQTGPVNQPLADPLVIQVTDQYGNVTPDQSVSWRADGGGSVTGTTPYLWTLGPTPNLTYTATAGVGGSQDATFTATAFCRPTLDGTMSPGEWACATAVPFQASISGGTTDAEVYWMNDDQNLYLAVRVKQSSLDKANNVRFDFDNDADGSVAEGDDAIGYDADRSAFSDEHLTRKCTNSGQSGCGEVDAISQDGAGAVGNDGAWTVYELSHPLAGDPGEDFVRAAGEELGFFLTLRVGKGAQGNTQWPGYRVFQPITIR